MMSWLPRWLGADIRQTWSKDLLSSLVVFLVAMPLCMGIALASGAPIAAGLVTGIIGGLIVGTFSGAPLQVSGPAAGLTVICGEVIREHGMPALGVACIIAGGLQFTAGILKWGQWFRAVSPAVIHGMLSGIGVLILTSQLHVMVDDRPRGGGLANIVSIPDAIWKAIPREAMGPLAERQARSHFLQRFGALHERQREIQAAAERLITLHSTEAQHEREAKSLTRFVADQNMLLRDLRDASAALRESPIFLRPGDRAGAVEEALQTAEGKVQRALDDLRSQRIDSVEESQLQACGAIAGVLGGLKNHYQAALMGLITIGVIIVWQAFVPKQLRLIPGPLLAVVAVTAIAWLLSLPVLYVEVPDNLVAGLTLPSWNVFQDVPARDLIISGIMLAVIASAETLLCASAVDRMHTGPRTQYDRELASQGVGNLLCGFVGGLPMTGVIVRSAANVQAGARTRMSSILHGLWLLSFVALLGTVLRLIPTAALAGILVYTGFKLIDWKGFLHLWKTSRSEALIFLATVTVIVVEDLLLGVVTGIVLSAIKLLINFSHVEVKLLLDGTKRDPEHVTLQIAGAATFLRLPILAAKLDEVPRGAHLHVDFEHLDYIDHACLELLMSWEKQHKSSGGQLFIDWGQLHARFRQERRKNNGNAAIDQTPVETTADTL